MSKDNDSDLISGKVLSREEAGRRRKAILAQAEIEAEHRRQTTSQEDVDAADATMATLILPGG